MADNLACIAERERGRGKILVFAHNAHLQRGQVTLPLGAVEARLTAAPGPARFLPTHRGDGLPLTEIAALPARSGSRLNPTYVGLGPQSLTDFDWLVAPGSFSGRSSDL